MRCRSLAIALAAMIPASAQAAGLGRPNVGGARPLGWAGAFTAVADDASALHHNPAGLATQRYDSVLVGTELIVAPRSYTPEAGEAQEPANTPNVLPTVGYVTRLPEDGVPSHLALGIGLWNTFGGQLEYDKGAEGMKAIDSVQTAIVEIVPGLAYEVNDVLQVGAALRIGLGLFALQVESFPADADVSGIGFTAGFTVGAMLRPSDWLRVGLAYRSPMDISISGNGELDELGNGVPFDREFEHEQEWPAQASLGFLFTASDRLSFALQGDWTDWSHVQAQVVSFNNGFTQTLETDFRDTVALHLAAQYVLSDALTLRGGYTFDSNAVPDRTLDRQYLDTDKHGLALGGSIRLSEGWSLDVGLEAVVYPERSVANNSADYTDWPERANVAPGAHSGGIYSLDLAGQYRY